MNYIHIILILIQIPFIARFHFEISKVNGFLEPINTIRKTTNPLILPVKRLIPFSSGKKYAAIVVVWVISVAFVWFFNKAGLGNALLNGSGFLISTWISFLQYGMFIYVIGTWIQAPAFQRINYLLHNLFAPLLRPIKQLIPDFGGIDFSPIIFLLLLSFVSNAFARFMYNL